VRLFLVDPDVFVPGYEPQLAEEDLAALGASRDAVQVYVVATLTDEGPVVNLLAPMLVARGTGSATQVILDGTDWPLRAHLSAAAA
jgi:flagellar assembly factor FliW